MGKRARDCLVIDHSMDSARFSHDGNLLCYPRHVSSPSYRQDVEVLTLITPLVAILKQLDATGTALSIIGMSWCIFHDHVIDPAGNLSLKSGYVILATMVLIQAILIGIPNIVYHGAFKYYGVSG